MTRKLRIAAAQYPLEPLATWSAYEDKIARWVADAQASGAELLVFPEYGAMELAAIAGAEVAADVGRSIAAVSERMPEALELHRRLARSHRVFVLMASGPERQRDGSVRNVAYLVAPDGACGRQEKQILIPFEREPMRLAAGSGLAVFDIGKARLGIAICYDIEFPVIGRALAEAGAEVLLAPANTEQLAGHWRVRIGAMARALENQCYAVQAPAVGAAPWCAVADRNTGAAGVFAPPDHGLPQTGVIAEGRLNESAWLHAELDLDRIAAVRTQGAVRNFAHWVEQAGPPRAGRVEVIDLAGPPTLEVAAVVS